MKYPFFLPYPKAWLKSIELALYLIPVGLSLYVTSRLTMLFFGVNFLLGKDNISFFDISWLIFCISIIPIFILASLYQFFFLE